MTNQSDESVEINHFADDISKFICLYENGCALITISLKFVPKDAVK